MSHTIVRFKAKTRKPPAVVIESAEDLDRAVHRQRAPVTATAPNGAPVRIHPELVAELDVEIEAA